MGNDSDTDFWGVCWFKNSRLNFLFPSIFALAASQRSSIANLSHNSVET